MCGTLPPTLSKRSTQFAMRFNGIVPKLTKKIYEIWSAVVLCLQNRFQKNIEMHAENAVLLKYSCNFIYTYIYIYIATSISRGCCSIGCWRHIYIVWYFCFVVYTSASALCICCVWTCGHFGRHPLWLRGRHLLETLTQIRNRQMRSIVPNMNVLLLSGDETLLKATYENICSYSHIV